MVKLAIRASGVLMDIFIIAAVSADGFIAKNVSQNSTGWTSKEDTQFFKKTTQQAVCVMGSTTYHTIGKPLPNRVNIVYTRSPEKLPVTHESLPRKKFLGERETVLVTTQEEPEELMRELLDKGYQTVAVCGGGSIYTQFMQAGVVDRLYLTIEPVVFGKGVRLFNDFLDQRLELVQVIDLAEQVKVMEYIVEQ